MALENILHMNVGSGEYSYANQSILQKAVILKARPYLEKTLMDMYRVDKFPACLKMADLGSSSGPNTLLSMSHIIEGVHAICHENEVKLPEFQVFFNDLPSNDFNTLFNLVPHYLYKKLKKKEEINCQPCYVNGVPGSFYERLFPSVSLDILHTSSTSQWLSQVPRRLESNKGNIYISNSSAPHIYEAYLKQFEQDLSTFLHLRSQEITSNGRMLITFCARRVEDPTSDDCCFLWNMLAKSLVDMQDKGVLCENDVNSFNIPMYFPSEGELKAIIEKEGSFKIESIDMFELNWDVRQDINEKHFFGADKDSSGVFLSKIIRAGLEPLLVNHFGSRTYIGNIFERYAKHANEHLSTHKPMSVDIVVSFKKK